MRRSCHQHQVARTRASAWSAAATHRGTPAVPRLRTKSITSRASVPSSDLRGSSMRACRRSIRATAASRSATVILGGVLICQIFTDASCSTFVPRRPPWVGKPPVESDTSRSPDPDDPNQLHRGTGQRLGPCDWAGLSSPATAGDAPGYRPPRGCLVAPPASRCPLPQAVLGNRRLHYLTDPSPGLSGNPLHPPPPPAARPRRHLMASATSSPQLNRCHSAWRRPLALDPGHAPGLASPATASGLQAARSRRRAA